MSEENVETVRQAYAAWERGDIAAIVELCDPEIVIVQPPEVPDSKSYRGHQGVIATFEDWPKQWDQFQARLGEIIEVDEHHVVSVCSQTLEARGMSLELEAFFLHTLERGTHVRLEMFLTREEALEAAGLSE